MLPVIDARSFRNCIGINSLVDTAERPTVVSVERGGRMPKFCGVVSSLQVRERSAYVTVVRPDHTSFTGMIYDDPIGFVPDSAEALRRSAMISLCHRRMADDHLSMYYDTPPAADPYPPRVRVLEACSALEENSDAAVDLLLGFVVMQLKPPIG
jgi:hypothetical protein